MMTNVWIALVAVLVMAGGLGGLFYLIIKQQAGITTKTIQFAAVVLMLPLMVALGITNMLGGQVIGTLLGVIVGYVLSGFGKE